MAIFPLTILTGKIIACPSYATQLYPQCLQRVSELQAQFRRGGLSYNQSDAR